MFYWKYVCAVRTARVYVYNIHFFKIQAFMPFIYYAFYLWKHDISDHLLYATLLKSLI